METQSVLTEDETLDGPYGLKIVQKRAGYRYSHDALALAEFLGTGSKMEVIDLGTGHGVIPLILVKRGLAARVVGVELQPELVSLARRNVALNGFGNVVDIVELDLRDVSRSFPCRSFDYVITNPPYREPRAGRITPTEQKAIARHEISCSMEDVMDAMKYLVKPRRRACRIYPSRRLPELVDIAGKRGLELKRLRFIHPRPDRGAELFMAELLKDGKPGVEVLPPLFTSEPPRGAGGFSGL